MDPTDKIPVSSSESGGICGVPSETQSSCSAGSSSTDTGVHGITKLASYFTAQFLFRQPIHGIHRTPGPVKRLGLHE